MLGIAEEVRVSPNKTPISSKNTGLSESRSLTCYQYPQYSDKVMKKLLYQIVFTLTGTSACFLQPITIPVAQSAAFLEQNCSDVFYDVTIPRDDLNTYQVFGQICNQSSHPEQTLQVLLSGSTYSHHYWDFDEALKTEFPTFANPEQYSYVDSVTQAGYATLNLDRIGIGLSDRPPGDLVDLSANAAVLSQIIEEIDDEFGQIIVVGHSFGSIIALQGLTQGLDSQIDGLILSGFLKSMVNLQALEDFIAALEPATQQVPGDSNYLTTRSGTRDELFYNQNVDLEVIATDETTKGTATTGELMEIFDSTLIFNNFTDPVLIAVGSEDNLFCPNTRPCTIDDLTEEAMSFPNANVTPFILENSGHSMNLHRNASTWFQASVDWADIFLGAKVPEPASTPETTSTWGLFGLMALGAVSSLQRKPKQKRNKP